jgi:hypothetical protein
VVESLKNMLLVLSTQGMLQRGETETETDSGLNLWNETWFLIDSVLPGLKQEVFPSEKPEK